MRVGVRSDIAGSKMDAVCQRSRGQVRRLVEICELMRPKKLV